MPKLGPYSRQARMNETDASAISWFSGEIRPPNSLCRCSNSVPHCRRSAQTPDPTVVPISELRVRRADQLRQVARLAGDMSAFSAGGLPASAEIVRLYAGAIRCAVGGRGTETTCRRRQVSSGIGTVKFPDIGEFPAATVPTLCGDCSGLAITRIMSPSVGCASCLR